MLFSSTFTKANHFRVFLLISLEQRSPFKKEFTFKGINLLRGEGGGHIVSVKG